MESRTKKQQRKTKRFIIIAGLIMIFLMVFSMAGVYLNGQSENALKYGNFSFKVEQVQNSQMYTTSLNGQKYYFYTLPDAAKSSIGTLNGMDRIGSANTLIFTEEPLGLDQQASSERITFNGIATDLSSTTSKTILIGITKQDQLSGQRVFSCNNATSASPVLILNESVYSATINITEVKPNCFELSSNGMDILIMRDYLLYRSLGVITD
jgi:hypothetical protein